MIVCMQSGLTIQRCIVHALNIKFHGSEPQECKGPVPQNALVSRLLVICMMRVRQNAHARFRLSFRFQDGSAISLRSAEILT